MSIANQAYKKDIGKMFSPLFFAGETSIFCINMNKPTNDASFNTLRLDLKVAGSNTILMSNVGTLAKMIVQSDFYNIKITFFCPSVPRGWYQLSIFDTATSLQKCVSNYIQVEEIDFVKNVSRVFFRHSYNKFGFNYAAYPDFYNVITLPLIQTAYDYQTDRKQYRNITDRKLRNMKSDIDKTFTVESYYMDEAGHDAMTYIYEHDTIFINNTLITPKDNYTVEQRPASVLSKGSINVLIDEDAINPNSNLIPNIPVYNPDFGNLKFA